MFWFQIYIFFCMICSLAFMNFNFGICFSLYISPKICSLMWQCWIFWWVLASVNELQFHSCFVFVSLYTCCLWIYRILIHMSLIWWLLLHTCTHTMFTALNVLKNWIVNLFNFLAISCILIPWFFFKSMKLFKNKDCHTFLVLYFRSSDEWMDCGRRSSNLQRNPDGNGPWVYPEGWSGHHHHGLEARIWIHQHHADHQCSGCGE